MIDKILKNPAYRTANEISFVLGQRVLAKAGDEWNELSQEILTQDEWEDLKDLCLEGNEKVQLETKGFASGFYSDKQLGWKFSFIEKKECFRAYFSSVKSSELTSGQIDNPVFWETLKKSKGIFIFAGEKRQGKTSLLQEIVQHSLKSKISIIGVHTASKHSFWSQTEGVVELGSETADYDTNHVLYEGLEKVVVDLNSIKNWKKWIEMAEQGQSIILTLSSNSVQTIINKLISELDLFTVHRLFNVLNAVVLQKLVGKQIQPCHEILLFNSLVRNKVKANVEKKTEFNLTDDVEVKDFYQSLNQSLIQKLVRRKIDLESAFLASDNPTLLDQTLKKMGL